MLYHIDITWGPVGKVLAAIMAIGSVGGIIANVRYLQRYGREDSGFRLAIAGLIFATAVLSVSIYVLRIRLSKSQGQER